MSKLFFRVLYAALFVLPVLPGDAASARQPRGTVHKLPPFTAERTEDLIHQFPPLRPVAGSEEPRETTPRPRKPHTAPTLEEAPRRPSDAPTLAEMEPPPQAADSRAEATEPKADDAEPKSDGALLGTSGPAAAFPFLPAEGLSPLVEIYAPSEESVARAAGGPLGRLAADLRSRMNLEDYLWSLQPAAAFSREAGPATPSATQEDEETPLSKIAYLLVTGLILSVLLVIASLKRELLRDGIPALIAKIRSAAKKEKEEEPQPALDLSRITKPGRAPPTPPTARAGMAPAARRTENETPRAGAPSADAAATGAPPSGPAAPAPRERAGATDDLLLVEPGDAAANSAALDASRTRQERTP